MHNRFLKFLDWQSFTTICDSQVWAMKNQCYFLLTPKVFSLWSFTGALMLCFTGFHLVRWGRKVFRVREWYANVNQCDSLFKCHRCSHAADVMSRCWFRALPGQVDSESRTRCRSARWGSRWRCWWAWERAETRSPEQARAGSRQTHRPGWTDSSCWWCSPETPEVKTREPQMTHHCTS